MNVLSIVGSPIKNGVTEKLVDELTKGIASKNDKVEINKIFLILKKLNKLFFIHFFAQKIYLIRMPKGIYKKLMIQSSLYKIEGE